MCMGEFHKTQNWKQVKTLDKLHLLAQFRFELLYTKSFENVKRWACPCSADDAEHRPVYTVESGKNVTFFEQLFCFYQLVLVLWNALGAKFKLSSISWVEQNWHFLWQWSKNLLLTHLGGLLWGNGGPGKIISPLAGSVGLHDSPLSTWCPCHVYSFFRCSPCLPWQRWLIRWRWPRYPRLQALRPVEHIFHCLPIVWFFRQAHKHPTKPNDQFLEILTCWTRWQASFFINLKGKMSKVAQMKSSFTKIFEAKKIGKNKSLGKKSYARRMFM